MPKVKPETLAIRREEILQAAETCFARQGFHQTTIQDVIRKSGLSAGCIYGHFASKEELIQAIGESRHARDSVLLASQGRGSGSAADACGRSHAPSWAICRRNRGFAPDGLPCNSGPRRCATTWCATR